MKPEMIRIPVWSNGRGEYSAVVDLKTDDHLHRVRLSTDVAGTSDIMRSLPQEDGMFYVVARDYHIIQKPKKTPILVLIDATVDND